MDTNLLATLAALQQFQAAQSPQGLNPTVIYVIGALIAAFTAWNTKRGEDTHKAVNSTATKLAEDKKVADAIATKQVEEISALREELRGKNEKVAALTPQVHPLTEADIVAIFEKLKAK